MREAGVYCEIHPCDAPDAFVREFGAAGVILSGSHMSAYEESTMQAPEAVFSLGVPVLGICYGMQTMAQQLGGRVAPGSVRALFNHGTALEQRGDDAGAVAAYQEAAASWTRGSEEWLFRASS